MVCVHRWFVHSVTSLVFQRKLCFFSRRASWGASCRGHCVRVTFGSHCWKDLPAAPSPACREPPAVLCCCSSLCWPTLCGTALWWTGDTGSFSLFVPLSPSTCPIPNILPTESNNLVLPLFFHMVLQVWLCRFIFSFKREMSSDTPNGPLNRVLDIKVCRMKLEI